MWPSYICLCCQDSHTQEQIWMYAWFCSSIGMYVTNSYNAYAHSCACSLLWLPCYLLLVAADSRWQLQPRQDDGMLGCTLLFARWYFSPKHTGVLQSDLHFYLGGEGMCCFHSLITQHTNGQEEAYTAVLLYTLHCCSGDTWAKQPQHLFMSECSSSWGIQPLALSQHNSTPQPFAFFSPQKGFGKALYQAKVQPSTS